mgnify:CR=1 FL=1
MIKSSKCFLCYKRTFSSLLWILTFVFKKYICSWAMRCNQKKYVVIWKKRRWPWKIRKKTTFEKKQCLQDIDYHSNYVWNIFWIFIIKKKIFTQYMCDLMIHIALRILLILNFFRNKIYSGTQNSLYDLHLFELNFN